MTAKRIYVAGHSGMVGSAIVRTLFAQGVPQSAIVTRTHAELDLCNQQAVQDFFTSEQPAKVDLTAAKVGGIYANFAYLAKFICQNLLMQAHLIHSAQTLRVQKLLFQGAICISPKPAQQPMLEDVLAIGRLASSIEPYALAKVAAIKLSEIYNCQYWRDYRSVIPTNIYEHLRTWRPQPPRKQPPHPSADLLISRNQYLWPPKWSIWGASIPLRDFLYANEMAADIVFAMNLLWAHWLTHTQSMNIHIKTGPGSDSTIGELAHAVSDSLVYGDALSNISRKPDGVPSERNYNNCMAGKFCRHGMDCKNA